MVSHNASPGRWIVPLLAALLGVQNGCTPSAKNTPAGQSQQPVVMVAPRGGAQPGRFRERVFYELWVRTFQDSDGDGLGDLRGLTRRLPELADLGIGGIWLMPYFPSPLQDSGYDVADYRDINSDYGNLEDFRAFTEAAHKAGILVYADMVFNHTSDTHRWFQSALNGPVSPYYDYFVWSDHPLTRCTDVPPSTFGSQRWQYVPSLHRYYFHQFYPRQPDLNFTNPAVREELLGVLRFWIDQGVDGFRFDVPNLFYEEGDLCAFRPETLQFHHEMWRVITEAGTVDRGFVGEVWGLPQQVRAYLQPEHDPMVFDFVLSAALYAAVALGASPETLAREVQIQSGLPAGNRWGLVLGNHDTPRFASLSGNDTERLFLGAAVQMTLPGVPFMWMGEELGLPMGEVERIDWRDRSRTPYPWDGVAPGYGFSTIAPSWLPFAQGSLALNYEHQRGNPLSVLNRYRALIALRNSFPEIFGSNELTTHYLDHRLWGYRRGTGTDSLLIAHNFARREAANMPLPEGRWRNLLSSDREISTRLIRLLPSQSVVLQLLANSNQ